MGRIPLLLPLNVKASEATGQEMEATPRLQPVASLTSRRASYAYGVNEAGSFSGVARTKEPRPSAAGGSDHVGGTDRAIRPNAGSLPGRETRHAAATFFAGLPSPSSSSFISSDGSTGTRIMYSSRHVPLFGHSIVNSNSSPLPIGASCPSRPSLTSQISTAAWVAVSTAPGHSPVERRSPVATTLSASAADTAGVVGQPLSGMSLVQFALNSCSTAEQQLRILLEERSSPDAASPSFVAQAQSLPLTLQAPASPGAAPHSPSLLTFRRAPAASAVLMGASTAVGAAPPTSTLFYPNSPSHTTRLESRRLAASACSSPITSPIPKVMPPAAAMGATEGLLAALIDHRQSLASLHPSAVRTERVTRFAANAELAGDCCAGEGQQEEDGQGEGAAMGDGGGRKSLQLLQSPSLLRQVPDGQEAEAQEHEHEPVKSRRAGFMSWAAVKQLSRKNRGDDSNQHEQHEPSACGGNGAGPAVKAAAMRAVAELKDMDEYSLVAAARHRQQQLAQRTGMSKHPTMKKVGSGVGKHSFSSHESDKSPADASSGLALGGLHAVVVHSQELPDMLGAGRTSCPEMGSSLDAGQLMATVMNTLRAVGSSSGGAGVGSCVTTAGVGSSNSSVAVSGSLASGPRQSTGDAAGDGGSGTFLPAVSSPRHLVSTTSSTRSHVSNSGGAAAAASSRGTGLTAPQPAAELMAGGGPGGSSTWSRGLAHAVTAGPAVPEQGEAAVRALAARFGSTALPDSRTLWDQDECDPTVRERRKKLIEALQAANPAAYHEEAAEAAESAYRALSERAQLKLRKLLREATTQEAPVRQLEEALRELTSQRPFFLPPVIAKPKVERTFKETDFNPSKELAWNVDDSFFAQRKKESESHELYDTEKIRLQQLNLDWRRVVSKARFRRMVSKGDLGVKEDGQTLEEELSEVREELQRQADFIRGAFIYYSMANAGAGATSAEAFQMSSSAWLAFCHDAGIVGKGCTGMDAQNIFVAVNFEEEAETEEAVANDDDAMVRFEFMEGLVRVAFAKYINTKRMTDASDALGLLLEEVVSAPGLPPEVRVDPNEWRRTRFYCPDVEEVLKEYWDLLYSMFKLYKARDRARYFWPEHFMAFLESNQLLGSSTGLTRREAKLIFAWSQSLVTDELRRRQRAVSLTLWDFIEAVGRVADAISPPDAEEIEQHFFEEENQPPDADRLVYDYYRSVGEAGQLLRRPSAGILSVPSRPLAPKLRLLLQYLVCSLREAWGGHDAREVAAKVMRTATFLSGGIEMG